MSKFQKNTIIMKLLLFHYSFKTAEVKELLILIKKRFQKILIAIAVILVLGISFTAIASAYSKNYNFEIRYTLTGSYDQNLANKKTSNKVSARAYNQYTDTYDNYTQYDYYVTLEKNWSFKSYKFPTHKSNGLSYTDSFSSIDSGTYRVNVTKVSSSPSGMVAKGSGTISQ